ncbi:hypothetical protein [Polyangium jinanense]|uniref:TonB C-terminal domain-containing protein n=1 Tax=Polyangium jinanense TaxID=2829994 RepID=A0A9X3XB00_9BACT|nr:hypothetical protein [Polyangium jinanense]MDC3960566.1 hypothetical protein [Polyangium jinanense]MDC3985428.1 hypothetical protein [Polyangium jinanense]
MQTPAPARATLLTLGSALLGASCVVQSPLQATIVSDPQTAAPAPQPPAQAAAQPPASAQRPEVAVIPIEDDRLFRAERAALRAELAAHLARVAPDYLILGPAMVDPKLRPVSQKTGHRCAYEGEPLSRRAHDEGWLTTDVIHVSGVAGGKGEELWVNILPRTGGPEVTFQAPWDRKLGIVDRYRAAFASLVRNDGAGGLIGGVAGLLVWADSSALREGPLTLCEYQNFGRCDPGSIDWKDRAGSLAACFANDDDVTRDFLVQGDAGGRYCEMENLDLRDGREGAREACVCQALVGSTAISKRPGRRTIRVRYEAPDLAGKPRPELRVIEASTNIHVEDDWHSMDQVVDGKKRYTSVKRLVVDNVDSLQAPLARCAAPAGSVIVVDLDIREDGVPAAGKVVVGTTDRELSACIERNLGRGTFTCTDDGSSARVRAALHWHAP